MSGSIASPIDASGSSGMAYTTAGSFAPARNRLAKISIATTDPTTIRSRPILRRSSNAITPPIVPAAEIAARKPTAMQNNRSVPHQPVIRFVAMTAVAHPDRMLTMEVTIAGFGSAEGARDGPTATGCARGGASRAGSALTAAVGGSDQVVGISPVGCRRMMFPDGGVCPRVGGSERSDSGWDEALSGARRMIRVSADERSREECDSDERSREECDSDERSREECDSSD